MISDETKAAILRKTGGGVAGQTATAKQLVSPFEFSNLSMMAEAAANAEKSMSDAVFMIDEFSNSNTSAQQEEADRFSTHRSTSSSNLNNSSNAYLERSQSTSNSSSNSTPAPHTKSNPYNTEAAYTRRDSGFISMTQNPASPQPHFVHIAPAQTHQSMTNAVQAVAAKAINDEHPFFTKAIPHHQEEQPAHQQRHSQQQHVQQRKVQQQPLNHFHHKEPFDPQNHAPPQPASQTQPVAPLMLNMTSIATRLHLNPTAIPSPQAFTHPTLGPTVSWTSGLLADRGITNPTVELSETQRSAFTAADSIILQAVKERNQFLEIARALVAECGTAREVGAKYLGILKQLLPFVPSNVQVGVKMDVDAIEKLSRESSAKAQIATQPTVAPALSIPASRPESIESGRGSRFAEFLEAQERSGQIAGATCSTAQLPPQTALKRARAATSTPKTEPNHILATSFSTASLSLPPSVTASNEISIPPTSQTVSACTISKAGSQTFPSSKKLATAPNAGPLSTIARPVVQVNPPGGYKLCTTVMNKEVVCAMAVSRPFKYLFTGSLGSVKIWDVSVVMDEAPQVGTIEISANYIRTIRLTQDGKFLVAGGESQDVSICNINTSTPHVVGKIPTGGFDTYTLTVTHDSRAVLVGGHDNCIQLWDIHTRHFIRTFSGHTAAVTCSSLSRDGTKLYSGSCDKTVRLWDVSSGQCLESFTFPSPVHSFDLNPLIPILTVGLEDRVAQRVLWRSPTQNSATSGNGNACNPGSSGGAGGAEGDESLLTYIQWDDDDGEEKAPWPLVKYSRSGMWFMVGGMNGVLSAFKESNAQNGAASALQQPQQFPKGRSGSRRNPVKVCDVPSDRSAVICGEISSCGNYLVSGGSNRTARVYKVVE
ncbi:hypothetical protein HDU78_009368 [Chytriomyces hyalinus]|nr:hypothetical protein HDU78_009368 [Chytriomyces hyalinus]